MRGSGGGQLVTAKGWKKNARHTPHPTQARNSPFFQPSSKQTTKMTGPQHDTPKKAHIRGAFEWSEFNGLDYSKKDLFRFFEVSRARGYEILNSASDRTRHNDPNLPEKRGRKRALSEADLDAIEDFYEEEGFEGRRIPYSRLLMEAGVEADACDRTIRTSLARRGIHKRIARQVDFTDEFEASRRLAYAEAARIERPKAEDWRNVYFSDEVHFGYGDEGKARIARKPGTANDPVNLQERKEPEEKDLKRLHAWGCIGYDFKSPLIWYEIPTNSNGKMTQAIYREVVLEGYVKGLMKEGRQFVLEEDGDSGHGPSQSNIVREWKEKNGLEFFFNCPRSPDLAPIENCWLAVKEEIRQRPHWDEDTLKELAEEGWANLSQETINNWIDSMPWRLEHVTQLNGKRTAW